MKDGLDENTLATLWDAYDWHKAREELFEMQNRLAILIQDIKVKKKEQAHGRKTVQVQKRKTVKLTGLPDVNSHEHLHSLEDDADKAQLQNLIQGNKRKIRALQNEIVKSLPARMLAVAHVSENTSSKPGVDGVRWMHPHQKMRAALNLGSGVYHALPSILYIAQGKRGKDRNIKLPAMVDRAMQTLYSYALEPISEVTSDKLSRNSDKLSYPEKIIILEK